MKDIPGFEGLYAATEDGRIWSYPKTAMGGKTGKVMRKIPAKFLKPYVMKHGYHQLSLYKDGCTFKYLVHQLIAYTFLPTIPGKKYQINHKNLNKSDNCVENLEWVSPIENVRHANRNGVHNRGERHGISKLSEKQVREIRKLRKEGLMYKEIAPLFGVQKATIGEICRGELWSHIT